jgi:N-methylhydantoinase A
VSSFGPSIEDGQHGNRLVFLSDCWHDTRLYRRDALGAGSEIEGPAIVDQPDTTILILPGWSGVTEPSGNLILRRR